MQLLSIWNGASPSGDVLHMWKYTSDQRLGIISFKVWNSLKIIFYIDFTWKWSWTICWLHLLPVAAIQIITNLLAQKGTNLFLLFCSSKVWTGSHSALAHRLPTVLVWWPPCFMQHYLLWLFFLLSAAAAAKSLQLCPTLCDPIDSSPPGSPSLGFSRQEHWSGLPFPSPMHESEKWKWSCSVMPDSQRLHGLQPTRLLCPWNLPGKSI